MRVLFAGTPEIAVPTLRALLASEHTVCGVLANCDKPRGRGRKPAFPAVKEALLEAIPEEGAIPLLQYEKLTEEACAAVAELKPDILAVYAYGKIFSKQFLDLFPLGGVNLHPSLLPRFRGPAPIPFAIFEGDEETGITLQQIALELDTGDILAQRKLSLAGNETSEFLSHWAADAGAELLVKSLDALAEGRIEGKKQEEAKATWTRKLERSDGVIDWNRSALEIDRQIRGCFPWPRGITSLEGKELHIAQGAPLADTHQEGDPGEVVAVDRKLGILVQTGKGLYAIRELQLKSKKLLDFAGFYNGYRGIVGQQLGGDQ